MILPVSTFASARIRIVVGHWYGYQSEKRIVLSWIRLVSIGTSTFASGAVTPM